MTPPPGPVAAKTPSRGAVARPPGRSATAADLPALAALDAACFGNPWSVADYRQELERPFARLWLLEDSVGLAAFCCAWVLGDEAHLLRIATRHGERRRGLGRRLLSALLEHAAASGCRQILLEVAAGNVPAVGLYTAFGFAPIGRRKGYYAHPPDDALVMRRLLPPPDAAVAPS